MLLWVDLMNNQFKAAILLFVFGLLHNLSGKFGLTIDDPEFWLLSIAQGIIFYIIAFNLVKE